MSQEEQELWTVEDVASWIGTDSTDYAHNWLNRRNIRPVAREPGRTGRNLYRAETVRAAKPRGDG